MISIWVYKSTITGLELNRCYFYISQSGQITWFCELWVLLYLVFLYHLSICCGFDLPKMLFLYSVFKMSIFSLFSVGKNKCTGSANLTLVFPCFCSQFTNTRTFCTLCSASVLCQWIWAVVVEMVFLHCTNVFIPWAGWKSKKGTKTYGTRQYLLTIFRNQLAISYSLKLMDRFLWRWLGDVYCTC